MDSLVAGARNETASLRRSWMWLLAFVIFHLVAISRQVDVDGISLFERTVLSFFSPVLNTLSSAADGVMGAWSSFVDLRRVGQENEALKARLRVA
jgi:hypothetical protein